MKRCPFPARGWSDGITENLSYIKKLSECYDLTAVQEGKFLTQICSLLVNFCSTLTYDFLLHSAPN